VEFPPFPDVTEAQWARAECPLRYEDIVQDGRLALEALAPALGEVVWRALLEAHPAAAAMREQGMLPILSRLVVEGGGGPFAVTRALDARGCYCFSHVRGADGEVERILVNMWVEASLPLGRQFGPPPERAGQPAVAGRLYAEHVLTRLFAEPAERKVRRLVGLPGVAEVPGRQVTWMPPAALLELPEGARPLEPARALQPQPVVFAVTHTDSNQHVNSLVYPRLFEDAAVRHLASLGVDVSGLLARWAEACFRKPCFAGDTVRLALQAFEHRGQPGVLGAFLSPEDALKPLQAQRPHTTLRLLFGA